MHYKSVISDNGKRESIMFCNFTKGGVDIFDQMRSFKSCGHVIKRWPLIMFYELLNAAIASVYPIFFTNTNLKTL